MSSIWEYQLTLGQQLHGQIERNEDIEQTTRRIKELPLEQRVEQLLTKDDCGSSPLAAACYNKAGVIGWGETPSEEQRLRALHNLLVLTDAIKTLPEDERVKVITAPNEEQSTALHALPMNGPSRRKVELVFELIRTLPLQRRPEILLAKTTRDLTPLFASISADSSAMTEHLLAEISQFPEDKKNEELKGPAIMGLTPLHTAVTFFRINQLKLLIPHLDLTDFSKKDTNDERPIDIIDNYRHREIHATNPGQTVFLSNLDECPQFEAWLPIIATAIDPDSSMTMAERVEFIESQSSFQ